MWLGFWVVSRLYEMGTEEGLRVDEDGGVHLEGLAVGVGRAAGWHRGPFPGSAAAATSPTILC